MEMREVILNAPNWLHCVIYDSTADDEAFDRVSGDDAHGSQFSRMLLHATAAVAAAATIAVAALTAAT